MHRTVTAMVTSYTNYRDNDRILHLFSPEQGMLSASSRGCRKPKSPLLPVSELFVFGEFVLFYGNGKYIINSCELRESFYPIREDYEKYKKGAFILALVNSALTDGQTNERIFTLLYKAMSYLAYSDMNPTDIAVTFALKLLDCSGYRPIITECAKCGSSLLEEKQLFFSPELGGAICKSCSCVTGPVKPITLEAMRRIIILDDEHFDKVKLPDSTRHELFALTAQYASYLFDKNFTL